VLECQAGDQHLHTPSSKSYDSVARTAHMALDAWAAESAGTEGEAIEAWVGLLDRFAARRAAAG
jgi:hypothetical protein